MLSLLTAYLIKNKKLYIPGLGSFRINELPATLDFANRLIYPPAPQVSFYENDEVDNDQLIYISEINGIETNVAEQQLLALGQKIKNNVHQSAFEWKGVGLLKYLDGKLLFESYEKKYLLPVTANKVFRENSHHAILVGEQEMQSNTMHEVRHIKAKKIPGYVLIAIIILILAIVFIAFRFYNNGFSTGAAGLG